MTTKRQLTSEEAIEADIVKIEEKHGPLNSGQREELKKALTNMMIFLYILGVGLRLENDHVSQMIDLAKDGLKRTDESILTTRKQEDEK